MKNTLCRALSALVLSTSLIQGAAAADQTPSMDLVSDAFQGASAASIEVLDATAMETTDGKVLPLIGYVATVAAVDLALTSVFWGIYVPNFAPKGARFSSSVMAQHH